MPRSKKRGPSPRAAQTKADQAEAVKKTITPQQYARRRAFGWTLVGAGVLMVVTHWVAHLGALYDDRPLFDLLIGYPMGGLLAIAGAIVLSD